MDKAGNIFGVDCATATSKGGRDYQEDAVLSDFAMGSDLGFAVLADGMGGHAAGDIASKIVVTVMFSELSFKRGLIKSQSVDTAGLLSTATETANQCIADYVTAHPQAAGMGATLVAAVIDEAELRWISVGDSPLYLFRDNRLTQLNADHSLASQLEYLVQKGALTAEEAACHPDRNVLTSVLMGEEIPQIDLPSDPLALQEGDIVILASDGLQALSEKEIETILRLQREAPSKRIASTLMAEVEGLGHSDLDNVTVAVMKWEQAHVKGDHAATLPLAENTLADIQKGALA